VTHNEDLSVHSIQSFNRRLDTPHVPGLGIVKWEVGTDHAVAERLEARGQQLPAGGAVPGAMEQGERRHPSGIPPKIEGT
jgi:hypothetical protein